MNDRKRLMLIDGHALAYRAYHAIPPLTGPSGEPTNAIFGFANMLLKAIQDYAPDYVVASFDIGRTFRHEEYAEYKATRARMPDDLRAQIGRVQELLAALNIPVCTKEGYEADDVMGTLSAQAAGQGLETIIVTGDSDTFQLISPEVKVLTPRKTFGEVMLYDIQAVRDRYGLEPAQLIDLKALVGDSSDNIKGVPGVGEKTALELLQKYGSLEAIYGHLDEVKPRFRKALEDGRQAATQSKHLVTIVRDVAVTCDLAAGRWGYFDRDRVMGLLRELGFRTLAARIPAQAAAEAGPPTMTQPTLFGPPAEPAPEPAPQQGAPLGNYHIVDTPEALDSLAAHLAHAERIAFDTETDSLDTMRAALVGISLSDTPGAGYYLPVGHDVRLKPGRQLSLELLRSKLGPVLADTAIRKIGHNAKFDMMMLARCGMPLAGLAYDTMIAAWILDPSGRGFGLKAQVWQRLGIEMTEIDELIGKGRNQITMDQVSVARVAPYAAADADMTLRLADALAPELEERHQGSLIADIEIPLVQVLLDMEMHGMLVDRRYLEEMSRDLASQLAGLDERIYTLAGHPFNIDSPKQLQQVLFDELKLKPTKRTTTGYSTDDSVLEELLSAHEIVGLVRDHRDLKKIKSTYADTLPALINPHTGRVHTSFNQAGTSTGRLSSSDPNLQNIPVRSDLGRRVRGAFIAPEGHVLLGCDYSQVELRLLAHCSGDPELVGAFMRGEDVHATTAAAIHGIPLSQVTPAQRALAKQINFGLMYGMGDYGLSSRTGLTVTQAHQFIDTYFTRFRQVKEYLDETVRRAHTQGYVETLLGRRRYFPELRAGAATNRNILQAAERAAVNMPLQGTAADIIKLAMIAVHRRLQEEGFQARMVLQVHDELVLEVPEQEVERAQAMVVETMENAYKLNVPLRVNAAFSKNWMEMK